MFNIKYLDNNKKHQYVHQNSWGFTTRSIGVMLMTHSDDKGLVIPPFMADIQVVIIPIYNKKNKQDVMNYIDIMYSEFIKSGNKVKLDDREDYTLGWKHNQWEQAGIPIRLEIGPRDVKNNTYVLIRRDWNIKEIVKLDMEYLIISISSTLDSIGTLMYCDANEKLKDSVTRPDTFDMFKTNIDNKKMCLIPWCNKTECEDSIKSKTGAKSLCIPINNNNKQLCDSSKYKLDYARRQPLGSVNGYCSNYDHCEYFEDCDVDCNYELIIKDDDKCVHCGDKAEVGCLFGKSF